MPYDDPRLQVGPRPQIARLGTVSLEPRDRRLVAAWLFAVCFMLWVMIALGGATRLTGSGLSIMEWAPLRGALPPLSDAEWQRLFALYKTIPQYALVNAELGLAGFKHIFWLEWTHRLWGRLIGIVFFVPLVWFWATGRIGPRLRLRLLGLFLLGGLQGGVGWFMVASGFLPDSTSVSPYRLVVHLLLALLLYAAILWTGLSVLRPVGVAPARARGVRLLTGVAAGLVALTMAAGGFVAGLHAGLDYNTFPLMDGHVVPMAYSALQPWWVNLTQNVAAVQFDHRALATVTTVTIMAAILLALRARLPGRWPLFALGAACLGQYALGVMTLLYVVPPALGTAHQAMAVLVLTAALASVHTLRPAPPAPLNRPGSEPP